MKLKRISVKLSWMLRHCQSPLYIDLNGGWADVNTIVTGARIRANQGHSIPGVVIEMESPEPPEFLYHGTAERFLETILKEGLKPMTRQFVHISPDYETAVKVGSRHGKPVILKIRARDFKNDGNELYRSSNGVWQARYVAPEYFEELKL